MKPESIFYFDFETGGLDYRRHAILQAAWITERNGVVLSQRCYDINPGPNYDLSLAALTVNNFTIDRMLQGKSLPYVLAAMIADIKEVCIGAGKVRPCGHNVRFDIDFLREASTINKMPVWELDFKRMIDTHGALLWLDACGKISLHDYKLVTACEHFGIELDAHDAMSDIRATRTLLGRLTAMENGDVAGV